MGWPNLSRETDSSGVNGEREKNIFPVQLTPSKVGNHTRLIHEYIHSYCTRYKATTSHAIHKSSIMLYSCCNQAPTKKWQNSSTGSQITLIQAQHKAQSLKRNISSHF